MLESSAELYGDGIAFYTKFEKGPYTTITHREVFDDVNGMGTALIARGMKERENCRNRRDNHIYVGHRISGQLSAARAWLSLLTRSFPTMSSSTL